MPQAAVIAGIQAAATIGGGIMASRSAGKARQSQDQANRRAEQFEREQFEYEKAQQLKQEQELQRQWEAYEASRAPYRAASASVMRRWGFDVPDAPPSSGPPPGWTPGSPMPGSGRPQTQFTPLAGTSNSMGDTGGMPPMTSPRLTLGNLSNWNRIIGL